MYGCIWLRLHVAVEPDQRVRSQYGFVEWLPIGQLVLGSVVGTIRHPLTSVVGTITICMVAYGSGTIWLAAVICCRHVRIRKRHS